MTALIRIVCIGLLIGLGSSVQANPKLNGLAIHNELGEEQFIAAVYSETPISDAKTLLLSNENKIMEIRVLADTLYARRFKRMWIEGIAINAGTIDLEKHAQHLADFSNLLRVKMKAGDVLKIERIVGLGTRITINGQLLGTIPNENFFDLLLRTWIGPVPLSSEFKQNLLAGGSVSDDLKERYSTISPTPERIAAVTAALETTLSLLPDDSKIDKPQDSEKSTPESTATSETDKPQPETPPAVAVKTPEPPQEKKKPKAPKPAKESEGLVSAEKLFADESIFSDEDEDFAFTAEGLLSEQVYISKLTKWTGSFVNYPRAALKKNQQGTVRLTVTIARNGKVEDVQFLEKSEHEYLNRAAAKAVRSASPYPAMPESVKGDAFLFTVPVVFRLQ